MKKKFLQVMTTVDDRKKADRLARMAVRGRFAACGQILGPVRSVYRWKGRIETSVEWAVLFKTTSSGYDGLEAMLRKSHPYEVPEIIALPIGRGSKDYLGWIAENVQR